MTDRNSYVEYKGKDVIIMICSKCNINCKHCYISYKGNRNPKELIDLVNHLKNNYNIGLNGAEVLTDPRYLEAYKIVNQHHILSNGKAILDDSSIIDKLKENDVTTVALSYHFGIQNDISVVSEDDLKRIMDKLRNNGIEYRFMTTINSDNYNRIVDFCDQAFNLGARAIKFTNYIMQGNALNLDKRLTLEQKKEFFEGLIKAREKYTKEDLIIERCGTFGKNLVSSKDNFFCDCITDSVVLTPDNKIYACIFLAKKNFEIGEYIDGKIMVDKNLYNNHDLCLTDEICNKGKKLLNRRI